jgi:hypothetical protein
MSGGAYAAVGAKLVERGYAAIPIMPGTKRPGERRRGEWVGMFKWREEYTRRLPSRFEIQIWAASGAGVCVVCGPASKYLIGVDIDTDDAAVRGAIISALPPTTVIKRGQKGDTRFYRAPAIDKSKSWNVVDAEGKKYRACDLIGPGRQTVMPPTIHPDTKAPYVWIGPDALDDINPDELPELTPEHIAAIDAALAVYGYEQEPEPAAERAATYEAGDLDRPIHRRLNDAAIANLSAWVPGLGLTRCKPTPSGFEAVATWRGSNTGQPVEKRKRNLKISRQGIVDFGDGPRNYTPLNLVMAASDLGTDQLDLAFKWLSDALGWNDNIITLPISAPKVEVAEAPPPSLPAIITEQAGAIQLPDAPTAAEDKLLELTYCKGLVGQIVDWIEKTGRRPNRSLALGAAVSIIGTLVGRRISGPTRSATHLYVVGLAPTGAGKQHPIDAISRLMRAANAGHHIGPSEFISMPAVINMLQRQPLALCAQDEFGAFLKRINSRRASGFEAGISKIFRSVWGISFGEYMTPEWAGRSASSVSCPALSVFGLSTPEEFYSSLGDTDLTNGFLNRFLIIPTGRVPSVVPELEPGAVPSKIADALSALYRWGAGENSLATAQMNNSNLMPEPIVLPWASVAASKCFTELERHIESLIGKDPAAAHFMGRTAEIAVRLATIRSVGRWGPYGDGPTVDLSDIEWGRDIALHCGLALSTDAKQHMAETDRQSWSNRILSVIRKRGTASMRQIQQHIRNAIKGGELKDILESLCDAGAIEKIVGQKGGKISIAGYKYTGDAT